MNHYTPLHLKAASKRAQTLGLIEVAQFMEEKYNDEYGHQNWVKDDLKKLDAIPENFQNYYANSILTSGIQDLISYVDSLANTKPLSYMAYVTFLEYFTVLAAPEFLEYVEKYCKIPRTSLSVVVKHGELDKIHVEDNLIAISKFIDSDSISEEFLEVIYTTSAILNRHFTECAEAA
jgi:hypothetical protein